MKICKFDAIKRLKVLTVITLVIVLVGMILFGCLGFAQTTDYSDHNEITVSAEMDFEGVGKVIKNCSDKYFAKKSISYDSFRVVDGEKTYIFTFSNFADFFATKSNITLLETELKESIETSFNNRGGNLTGLLAEVSASKAVSYVDSQVGGFILCAVIILVVLFAYAWIFEKLASAITTVICAVIAGIFQFAFLALVRVPFEPFGLASIMFASIFASMFVIVNANRVNEQIRNVGNDKASYKEIFAFAYGEGVKRIYFVAITIIVAGLLLLILGPSYFRFAGLQVVLASASALVGCKWAEFIWPSLKNFKKDRVSQPESK